MLSKNIEEVICLDSLCDGSLVCRFVFIIQTSARLITLSHLLSEASIFPPTIMQLLLCAAVAKTGSHFQYVRNIIKVNHQFKANLP